MSDYMLHELLAEGGMGAVYAGDEVSPSGKSWPIACKVMSREFRDNDELMRLFRTEAETNRRISDGHDGLVKFYHWFRDQEQREFLIMELVPGCSLEELCSSDERLSFDVIRLVARDALDVLAYVHGHDVVHRDISPCNVLVSCEGRVKLLDFGLAKASSFSPDDDRPQRSVFRGKRQYVSPEVVMGQGADERSDLYSFASMLFELLTGEPPFGADVTCHQLHAIANAWHVPELPVDIPEDLRKLTMGLLRRHPHEREPATAAEARDMLVLDDADAARTALAGLAEAMHQRRKAVRAKARKRGSFAGVWIRGMHITHGVPTRAGRKARTYVEGRRRSILRYGLMSVIGIAAVAALALAVYGLQRNDQQRVIQPAPASASDTSEPTTAMEPAATVFESSPAVDDSGATSEGPVTAPSRLPQEADGTADGTAKPQEVEVPGQADEPTRKSSNIVPLPPEEEEQPGQPDVGQFLWRGD